MNFRRVALLLLSAVLCLDLAAQSANDLTLNVIAIDAGHGGKDPGTVSADRKTYEKTIALKLSQLFAERVRKEYPDMKVVMTRDRDMFVTLADRPKIATRAGAKLFVSIHINSASSKNANGFAAYTLGESSNKNVDTYALNRAVVERENSSIYLEDDTEQYGDLDSNSPEARILSQLMFNAFREQSLLFAEMVSQEMGAPFKSTARVNQGNFQVLRQASMPAVLLEFGFMTNAGDLALLRSDKSLQQMADNLFTAFRKYKTAYDASVTGSGAPAVPAPAPAAPEAAEEEADAPLYGTQVLVSSRVMKDSDSYFLGYPVRRVQAGSVYKYVIGLTKDPEEAKKTCATIQKKYKDAFLVRIEGDTVSMLR